MTDSQFRHAHISTPRRVHVSCAAATILCALGAGCELLENNELVTLRQENQRLQREVGRLERESITTAQAVADLKTQVGRLQHLGAKRLELLYSADRIEIEQLSGGYDDDKQPGDDGVIVYLRPLDRVGDPIKAAGDIRIELFDLGSSEGERKIAECIIPVAKAEEMWYGRFMTYHYTIRCPWQGRPPTNPEITIRASFLDYLTGRELNATREVRVLPPPNAGAFNASGA